MRSFVPTRPDIRATLRLAAPVVTVQLGMMLMGIVDTAFVGRVSTEALAAVGLGNLWSWGSMVFGVGVLLAVGPLLAQAHGAGDRESFGRTLRRGVLLSLVITVLAVPLQLACEPALLLMGQSPELAHSASEYVLRTVPGTIGFYLFAVLREALQSTHRLRPVVVTIVGANLLNVVVDYGLVMGHFGLPALGANGAAWATAIARTVMAIGVIGAGWPILKDALTHWTRRDLRLGPLLRTAALGLPIGGQMILEFGGFGGVMILMGHLGTTEVAAHQVTVFIAATAFMVPLGVSQAAGVLVGNAVGRGDAGGARRAAGAAMGVGTAWMCCTATVLLAAPGLLAGLLTNEPDALAIAVTLVPLAGMFQIPDGIQVVSGGILRGIADVWVPFALNFVAFWMLSLPLGYWLTFHEELGPRGLWWGLVAGLTIAAVLLTARVLRKLSGEIERTVVE
jgi:MATE family multidrug resistance protein